MLHIHSCSLKLVVNTLRTEVSNKFSFLLFLDFAGCVTHPAFTLCEKITPLLLVA